MNTRKITFTALAGVLFAASPASAEVTWSVDNGIGTAEGEGSYGFTASQALTGMEVRASGDGITLTGEGLVFSGTDPVVSLSGTSVFDLPIVSEGMLSFLHSGWDTCATYGVPGTGYDSAADFLYTNDYKTVFHNMDLSDFYPSKAYAAGAAISDGTEMTAFCVERGEGWLTCQFQCNDGYIKCLKTEFVQDGTDVKARILYAGYITDTAKYGIDFETVEYIDRYVAMYKGDYHYGIYSIVFRRIGNEACLTLNRNVEAAGLVVGEGVAVTADPGDILAGSDVSLPDMEINGSLTVTNTLGFDFSNALSGSGELYIGGYPDGLLSDTEELTYANSMPTEWTTVMYGGLVSSITNVYINAFEGEQIPYFVPGWICNLKANGTTLTGQCQTDDGTWLKCVYLEFQQISTNIQARIKDACYCHNSLGLGVDFDTLEWTTETPTSENRKRKIRTAGPTGYGIKSFTLCLDVDTQRNLSALVDISFNGANTMSGGEIHQRGGTARIRAANALSSVRGVYTVSGAGTLVLEASDSNLGSGIGNGKTELRATDGSTIKQTIRFQIGDNQNISLDNGTLNLANTVGTQYDFEAAEYVNFVTLANGSRVTGRYPRIGRVDVPTWKVTGDSPSFLDAGMITYSMTSQVATFDIEDVTDDDEADFTVAGTIMPFNAAGNTMCFRKKGDGTMSLKSPVLLNSPLRLDAGTLRLDDSGILCGKSSLTTLTTPVVPVQFGGGALAGLAGTSNDVGYVTLTNDSRIVLGEGAVFTFPDCSSQEWADGMELSITGAFTPKSVRFGTNRNALTSGQQAALRINGEKAILDSQGYVRDNSGLIITVR